MSIKPLVGRETNLANLRACLARASSAIPTTVLIAGEAGIGKTSLVEAFLADAAGDTAAPEVGDEKLAGPRYLVGHCVPMDGEGPAFAPFVGVLRALCAEFGEEEVLRLAGPGGSSLAALLPELETVREPENAGRERLFGAVVSLLECVADRRPLIVVIEDLHWADAPTRSLFGFLTRALTDCPVLLIATYRTDELYRGHPLRPLIAELDRQDGVYRCDLERLSRSQVAQQIADLSTQPRASREIDLIFDRSEGIPFFVAELASLDCTSGVLPDSLQDLLLVRVEQLRAPTQRLLRLAAAAGNRVDHGLLAEACELDPEALDELLREAIGAGVLIADDRGYAFRHALLREALQQDTLPGERARLHRRYAELLAERPELGGSGGSATMEIAHHWYAAHDVEQAFTWALAAERDTARSHAYLTAGQLAERALDLWDQVSDPVAISGADRIELMVRAAGHAMDGGDADRSTALLRAASEQVDPAVDPLRAGTLLARFGVLCGRLSRPDDIGLLEKARSLVESRPPSPELAFVLDKQSAHLMLAGQTEQALEVAARARRIALDLDLPEVAASAEVTLGTAQSHRGDATWETVLEGALNRAEAGDEVRLRYYFNRSDFLHLLGRYEEAIEVATEGQRFAESLGLRRGTGSALMGNAADPLYELGRWDEAKDVVERILALDPPHGHSHQLLSIIGRIAAWRGETDTAEELFARSLERGAAVSPLVQDRFYVAQLGANLALSRGAAGAAWSQVSALLEDAALAGIPSYAFELAFDGAVALRALKSSGAISASEFTVGARRVGAVVSQPSGLWSSTVWPALVSAILTDDDAWTAVDERLAQSGGPVIARVMASKRCGELAVRRADRSAAITHLRSAGALARSLGATRLAATVDDSARRARIDIRPPASTADNDGSTLTKNHGEERPGGLTDRELDVLRLIARGRSNREIGEDLFISAKTASVHVSNILGKLGLTSRGEAAAWAHSERLAG